MRARLAALGLSVGVAGVLGYWQSTALPQPQATLVARDLVVAPTGADDDTLANTSKELILHVSKVPRVKGLPSSVVWRSQTYTLDQILGAAHLTTRVVIDPPVTDPKDVYLDTDVLRFDHLTGCNANPPSADPYLPVADPWSVRVLLLTKEKDAGTTGYTTPSRRVIALYMDTLHDDPTIMRTLVHEIGHALNLFHNDGDALDECCANYPIGANTGRSLMNQDLCASKTAWAFAFSPKELDHLLGHPMKYVMPGDGRCLGDCVSVHARTCL